MSTDSRFPWELLKAECLRLVCTQLVQGSNEGGNYQGAGRKEDMIDFLRDVDARGLEPAVKKMEETQTPRKATGAFAPEEIDSPKRKSSRLEEAEADAEGDSDLVHNTRYKGAKRVKLTKEDPEPESSSATKAPRKAGPGRPRKSVDAAPDAPKRGRGRPRKSDVVNGDAPAASTSAKKAKASPKKTAPAPAIDETGAPIKRGRGRPRKSVPGAPAPQSKGKSVFDGVLLDKRKPSSGAAGEQSEEPKEGGEENVEEDAVLAVVNSQGQGDASSLGGSNKENDPNDVIAADDHDVDADADGEPDPQAPQAIVEVPTTA